MVDLVAGLRTFVRITETGSFSAVAREMKATQSVIARQIAQLEGYFGLRLMHRTTRRLSLTDDGSRLLDHARTLLDEAEAMETALRANGAAATGLVRVALPVAVGLYLAPRLPALLANHPGLAIDLVLNDRRIDLIEESIDLALRGGEIADSSLVVRRVATFSPVVVASPAYLRRGGTPTRPEDLTHHCCITQAHGPGQSTWRFSGPDGPIPVKVSGAISVNDSEAAHLIAVAGQGIAMLPVIQVVEPIRQVTLVRLLRDYPAASLPLHIVYPSRRNLPPRTRVVIEFLADQIKAAGELVRQLD